MQFRELQEVVNERGEEAFDTRRKCCENDFEEPVARFGNVYKLIAWLNEKGE